MKFAVALVVSVVIGGALLYIAGRDLPLDKVLAYVQGADWGALLLALLAYGALYGAVHALRVWRWSLLVRALGDGVRARDAAQAAVVGFAAIVLLPLRLGELVRPYALSKASSCSMPAALGTVVVERVIDGLFVTLLLFVTLATYRGDAGTDFAMAMGQVSLAIFCGALGVCLVAAFKRDATLRALGRLLSPLSPSLAAKVVGLLGTFLDGIGGLRAGGALGRFVLVTALYWTLNGVSIALLAQWGFGLALTPWGGMTVLAVLVVGLMIPGGPGLTGNYELFALRGLGLFVPAEALAVQGVALVAALHIVQFIVQVAPGLVALWGSPVGLLGLSREAQAHAAGLDDPDEGTASRA